MFPPKTPLHIPLLRFLFASEKFPQTRMFVLLKLKAAKSLKYFCKMPHVEAKIGKNPNTFSVALYASLKFTSSQVYAIL